MEERIKKLEEFVIELKAYLKCAAVLVAALGISLAWIFTQLHDAERRLDSINGGINGVMEQVTMSGNTAVASAIRTQLATKYFNLAQELDEKNDLDIFVNTESMEPALISLAGMNSYTHIERQQCEPRFWKGMKGIRVFVKFDKPPEKPNAAISFSLLQPGAITPTQFFKFEEEKGTH